MASATARPSTSGQPPPCPFTIELSESGEPAFTFPETIPKRGPGVVPLKAVLRSYVAGLGTKALPPRHLYHVLGKLRALQWSIDEYNAGIGSDQAYHLRYRRVHTLNVLSGFGFQVASKEDRVEVDGLQALIAEVERLFAKDIAEARLLIAQQSITFDALQELYRPGTIVTSMTACTERAAFRVVHGFYEERRMVFGVEKSFHLQMEYVAVVGEAEVAVVPFEEVLSGWTGARARSILDLGYVPATEAQVQQYDARGALYEQYSMNGRAFLRHNAGSFFIHGSGSSRQQQQGQMSTSAVSAQLASDGRIMVDCARGSALGHYASQGGDEATHALMTVVARYRRAAQDATSSSDAVVLFRERIPKELRCLTWPALVGFSFSAKCWGHVLVSGLTAITFNDRAFDDLVLDANRKKLIRALVRFGGKGFDDIIAGKSGGSIFLLHGPPGVGKTLTAEAIAEVLHRPLYYVTMGELGLTPDTMEQRLKDVLTLCSAWDALVLIDEADVFLEKRSTSDIVRNAMVCVMLRLLEYFPGILFLTTNRVADFDPAFESRVTVALRYDHLDAGARQQVWRNLLARVPVPVAADVQYERLGEHVMNGRQIKNAVRLALALAEDAKQPLGQELLDQTIGIVAIGRAEMASAEKY